jgi:ribosomal protein S18 acetylase RimI-like enzyme
MTVDPLPGTLRELMIHVAAGHLPPADGGLTVLRQPADALAGVLAFTGHHVIAADVDADWVARHLDLGDMSAPVGPRFIDTLAGYLGRSFDNLDLVLVAGAQTSAPLIELVEVTPDAGHLRVARSLQYRTDVRTFVTTDGAGLLVVARGLGGRWEAAFEVDPTARGRGIGRMLAASALSLLPAGSTLFLQISPGNAASLRAVLATGLFSPIGAEILFPPV